MSTDPEEETGSWLRRYLDADRAVGYALAMRCWQFPAGLVTAVLVAFCFTPQVQGLYYTAATLLGLQTLLHLGLHWVIIHFASHEWAELELDRHRRVVGDDVARQRLAGLLRVFTRWFIVVGLLFGLVVGVLGAWLFFRETDGGSWFFPWCGLVFFASASLALSPYIAIMEGCQQVLAVHRVSFYRAVTGSLAVWGAMLSGVGLWALVAATFVQVAWELYLIGGSYRLFFASLRAVPARLDWKRELWPLQWRIGAQSISGFFAFYLFTPVMFAYHGAEVAGQMGMSWNILSNIQQAAFAWIRTRAPYYGQLIARGEYGRLDQTFFRGFLVSLSAMSIAYGVFLACVFGLSYMPIGWMESLSRRLLDPTTLLVLAAGLVLIHVARCLAVYLRAHKRDPLLRIVVVANVMISVA
ncbi:MAG: hypothetical protein ACODAD_02690, partial [Planctomycetota bacterium]